MQAGTSPLQLAASGASLSTTAISQMEPQLFFTWQPLQSWMMKVIGSLPTSYGRPYLTASRLIQHHAPRAAWPQPCDPPTSCVAEKHGSTSRQCDRGRLWHVHQQHVPTAAWPRPHVQPQQQRSKQRLLPWHQRHVVWRQIQRWKDWTRICGKLFGSKCHACHAPAAAWQQSHGRQKQPPSRQCDRWGLLPLHQHHVPTAAWQEPGGHKKMQPSRQCDYADLLSLHPPYAPAALWLQPLFQLQLPKPRQYYHSCWPHLHQHYVQRDAVT